MGQRASSDPPPLYLLQFNSSLQYYCQQRCSTTQYSSDPPVLHCHSRITQTTTCLSRRTASAMLLAYNLQYSQFSISTFSHHTMVHNMILFQPTAITYLNWKFTHRYSTILNLHSTFITYKLLHVYSIPITSTIKSPSTTYRPTNVTYLWCVASLHNHSAEYYGL